MRGPLGDNVGMSSNPWRLEGRLCLVTGASKGIGRQIVREFISLGATVIACARDLGPLRSTLAGSASSWVGVEADVTDPATVQRLGMAIEERGGRLHALVNNAGRNIRKETLEYTEDDFEAILDLNLRAAWRLVVRLHPFLVAAGGASVINIGSVASDRAVRPSTAAYAASKGGLDALTTYLSAQWAPQNIRVNTVAPWYVRTPLAEPILSDPAKLEPILARTPLGRIGEPEDVARAVAFLAMPASGWITGIRLPVDGGFTALGS